MTNDLNVNDKYIWKVVDDTASDEMVKNNDESNIPTLIDDL